MKPVTRLQANDGTEWATEREATIRDALLDEIKQATSLLLTPVGNRRGYVQQDPARVLAFKVRLIEIGHKHGILGTDVLAEASRVHPHSIVGRYIDDSGCRPIGDAWTRLMCIDEQGREWEQPYYALNPGKGPDVCLNLVDGVR